MTRTNTIPAPHLRTTARTTRNPIPEPHGTCGLTVRITPEGRRPTLYDARPLRPDPGSDVIRAFALTKAGTADRYDVAMTIHGPECTCPDYAYARDGRDPHGCKHCRALISLGLI